MPGTKLKEVPMAELFGVTRGTIRKAFTQLASRRVIELIPNRGATVAMPTIRESRDLLEARRTIECAVVKTLAQTISKANVGTLRALVKAEDLAYRRGNLRIALKLSVDFHRVLAAMAGNAVMEDLLDQLVARTPLVVLAYRDAAQSSACANKDHAQLVAAIATHDAERAMAAMHCHLCNLEGQLTLDKPVVDDDLAAIFR